MAEDSFVSNIKQSFVKAKEDINALYKEVKLQKEVIIIQNEAIKQLNQKLTSIYEEIKEIKENLGLSSKKIVNQSINNQSTINQQSSQNMPGYGLITLDKGSSIGNDGVNQSFNHLINQQSINQSYADPNLLALKTNLEAIFRRLSKQELKVFLTIYQLEDENIEPNYFEIANRMQLSEHCIRSHISALVHKNVPLTKKRLNNRTNVVHIRSDFKALNLKQKLISMYYETDPHQTTLFEIK